MSKVAAKTKGEITDKIEIAEMQDMHCAAVAEFFAQVWDPNATEASVRSGRQAAMAANPFQPGQNIPTILFLSNGKVLGYVSSIPVSLWTGAEQQPAFWVKGLMVLPEHRNGPIGYYLVKELMKRTPCALSLTVSDGSRRLFTGLGFKELGRLSNHLQLLRPGRIAHKLDLRALGLGGIPAWVPKLAAVSQKTGIALVAGSMGGLAFNTMRALTRPSLTRFEVSQAQTWPADDELDLLWHRMASQIKNAAVRDSRYLPWRYPIGGSNAYGIVTVRHQGKLAGIGILRRPSSHGDPRLRGIRIATLSDILYDLNDPDTGIAVLKACRKLGANFDADAILCSTGNRQLGKALTREGYLPAPANLYFLWREPGGKYGLSNNSGDWWLTRGDMNADEVF